MVAKWKETHGHCGHIFLRLSLKELFSFRTLVLVHFIPIFIDTRNMHLIYRHPLSRYACGCIFFLSLSLSLSLLLFFVLVLVDVVVVVVTWHTISCRYGALNSQYNCLRMHKASIFYRWDRKYWYQSAYGNPRDVKRQNRHMHSLTRHRPTTWLDGILGEEDGALSLFYVFNLFALCGILIAKKYIKIVLLLEFACVN